MTRQGSEQWCQWQKMAKKRCQEMETCYDYYKEGLAHQSIWRGVTGGMMTDGTPEAGTGGNGATGGTSGGY